MANSFKISKPFADVKTAPDNDLIFNSDYPLFKIHKQGSGKITTDGFGLGTVEVLHDVGKVPMYFVLGEFTSDGFSLQTYLKQYPFAIYIGAGTYAYFIVKPHADKLEIRVDVPGMTNSTFKYIYYIFEDPIIL